MGDKNTQKTLVRKPFEKWPLQKMRSCKNNITIGFRKTGKHVWWMGLDQNRVQLRSLITAVLNILRLLPEVSYMELKTAKANKFQSDICLHSKYLFFNIIKFSHV
jgi:hypothetical protein